MISHRRRGASRPEFYDGHSGPQSGYSSSVSTAHHGIFSTTNSHMTTTDESTHSVENNTDLLDQVALRVYREEDGNSPMLLCYWANVTPRLLRSYSVKLVDDGQRQRIDDEDCLVYMVASSVSATAFRLMVDNIDKVPTVSPSPSSQRVDISFLDLFELCVVLWSHVCKIDHWVFVAEQIRDSQWEDDFKQWPAGRLTQWLFIALVFDWPNIFEMASSSLIVDFSDLDAELNSAHYLPLEVISAMTDARRGYMRKTYDKIRNISLILSYDHRSQRLSLLQDIRDDLFRSLNFDLREHLPEDIHKKVSPGDVLEGVRKTIGKARSVPEAQTPVPHPTESIAQASPPSSVRTGKQKFQQRTLTEMSKTTRTTEGGEALIDVMLEVWHFAKDAKKRRRKPSSAHLNHQQKPQEPTEPAPLTPQEIDDICESLLEQLQEFRTSHLRPLNIDDFSTLRAKYVLPASRH